MLKDGTINTILIRLSILGLRTIAPVSIFYTVLRLYRFSTCSPCPVSYQWVADIWMFSEAVFFLGFYLHRRYIINQPAASYVPLPTRQDRRDALIKTFDASPDPRRYVGLYFHNTPLSKLRSDDIRQWLLWRLWNNPDPSLIDTKELDEYLQYTEEVLEHRFQEGRSPHTSMAVTLEPVRMVHRPLLWYVVFIGSADTVACITLWLYGFRFHRYSKWSFLESFPLRPVVLLSSHKSPSKSFSYWLLPHTPKAKTHLPIVFVHGVGVGYHFYTSFLNDLLPHCHRHGIGILCVEIPQVCSRISSPLPPPRDMTTEMLRILDHHGWQKIVLVTHSYGSVVAAHMLQDSRAVARIGPLVFADPVCFSFHPPDVAYNFLRRRPQAASQWQLWYFASTDPDVSRVLTRSFRWSESSLWREDLETRNDRSTIFLAGADIITDVETTGAYLARKRGGTTTEKWYRQPAHTRMNDDWKRRVWTGSQSLEVIYSKRLNHAEIFEEQPERSRLVRAIEVYTTAIDAPDQR